MEQLGGCCTTSRLSPLFMMLLLRLYPRRFRDSFESEMLATFHEVQRAYQRRGTFTRVRSLVRELLGVLGHIPAEWIALHNFTDSNESANVFERNIHRLTTLTATVALQALIYSCLLPIGSTAKMTTGLWLRSVAVDAVTLAVLTEFTYAVFERVRKHQ